MAGVFNKLLPLIALAATLAAPSGFAVFVPPFQLQDYEGVVVGEGSDLLGDQVQVSPVPAKFHDPSADAESRFRLPTNLMPTFYSLALIPDIDSAQPKTEGFVEINFDCIEDTAQIQLHVKLSNYENLELTALTTATGSSIGVDYVNTKIDSETDIWTIPLFPTEEPLKAGQKYKIKIEFTSFIKTDPTELNGLYLSTYQDPSTGETRRLVATQFQSTHARALFPCFDEPRFKAVFELLVGVPVGRKALSNTIGQEFPSTGATYTTMFEPTPKMSPYLLALVISDFTSLEAPADAFHSSIAVWGAPHYIAAGGAIHATFAKSALVNYYENFTGIEYELPKFDSVAVPQFAAGAMENWGLNTYRTEYLLHIPGENTEADRKKITQVLAHEITHQWYGNLITCEWWAEAWLNEGFARFLQYRGMQHAVPELVDEAAIVSDAVHLAMIFDQGLTTHPILKNVETQAEASAIFNRISYEKAASLLRMLESVLSRESFDNGIRDHLKLKVHGTVTATDLWESFKIYSGGKLPNQVDVSQFMQSWTTLSGYPILRVKVFGPNRIAFTQEKFTPNGGTTPTADLAQSATWFMPVSAISASAPAVGSRAPKFWLDSDSVMTVRTEFSTTEWNVFNAEVAGYYRVLYDDQLLKLIKDQLNLNHQVFTPATRSQILEDYFQFANSKYVPIESALELTSYLGKETHLSVWTPVIPHLRSYIQKLAWNPSAVGAFANYFLPKIAQVLDTIGWNNQTADERGAHVILRAQLFDIAVTLGDVPRKTYAAALFDEWATKDNRSAIPVDLRPSAFCAGIETANQTTWYKIRAQYNSEVYPWTKAQLLKALSCSADPQILLSYIVEAAAGASEFGYTATLQAVAQNTAGQTIAFEWAKDMLLVDRNSETKKQLFASVLSTLSTYWSTSEQLRAAMAVVQQVPNMPGSVMTSLARIQDNIDWWTQTGSKMALWLGQH